MLPPCPHCGDTEDGVYVNQRWFGWAQYFYDSKGQHTDTSTDKLRASDFKTVRCARCCKVRRDVVLIGNEVQPK